ncbi:MAG: hypothetical protein K5891_07500 [Lachnospiraceae bacterium]|nr:hypothetical protein [Lachnospiraceae bacterium]
MDDLTRKKLVEKMGKLARPLNTINDIDEFEIEEMFAEMEGRNESIEPFLTMTDEELVKAIKAYDFDHRWDPFYG